MGGKQRLRTGSVYERERMKEEKDQQRRVYVWMSVADSNSVQAEGGCGCKVETTMRG